MPELVAQGGPEPVLESWMARDLLGDADPWAAARDELRHALDVGALRREIRVGVEILGELLDEKRQVFRDHWILNVTAPPPQEVRDDLLAGLVQLLRIIVGPLREAATPILHPLHLSLPCRSFFGRP